MTWDCPACGTSIQRIPEGTLNDGMARHYQTCHPGQVIPVHRP